MKIVPIDTPPVMIARDELRVRALTGVKAVKPVQPRTLVPLVTQPHGAAHEYVAAAGQPEKRHVVALHGERRVYCRRVQHLPVLLELRSGLDRRRHNQREGEVQEHVDIEA